jgi:hypothetical protein
VTDLSNRRCVVDKILASVAEAVSASVTLSKALDRGDALTAQVSADVVKTSAQSAQCLAFKLGNDIREMRRPKLVEGE